MYFVVSGTSSETTLEQNSSALNEWRYILIGMLAQPVHITSHPGQDHSVHASIHCTISRTVSVQHPQKNHLTLGIASVKS